MIESRSSTYFYRAKMSYISGIVAFWPPYWPMLYNNIFGNSNKWQCDLGIDKQKSNSVASQLSKITGWAKMLTPSLIVLIAINMRK